MSLTRTLLSIALAISVAGSASAQGIGGWLDAIQASSPGYSDTDIAAPMQADIGSYDASTGVTYEFIYNADVGGASSAFMGSLSAPAGDSAGLKLDQWNLTGKFGATVFGVADFTFDTDYVLNADTHVVFAMDGADTNLYVNGALAETIPGVSFGLSGLTGIGHAYNHGNDGSIDPLNGTILGVAVYDTQLDAATVQSHFDAFVPEPNSFALIALGCLGLAGVRRR